MRQIVFSQGTLSCSGDGRSAADMRLQASEDGVTWQDAKDWVVTPPPNTSVGGMLDFLLTFSREVQCRGVRTTGTLGRRARAGSTFLRVREFQVFSHLASPRPLEIDYHPNEETVAEGAYFGVRPRQPLFVTYQWQRSSNQGKSWENIPGANCSYYQTPFPHRDTDDGTLYRRIVSNGTSPDALSRPATLKVTPTANRQPRGKETMPCPATVSPWPARK